MRPPSLTVRNTTVSTGAVASGERCIPEEVPVALVYDGTTYAVMMASPSALEDFAVGFSLTEGIVAAPEDISSLDVIEQENGIELRMWLTSGRGQALGERRRHLAGPTGCGLCGIESLEEAVRGIPKVASGITVSSADIAAALAALSPAQALNRATHAVHGAGFWTPKDGLVAIAEDVGRHNALDKLVGALHRARLDAARGVILLTSRVSVEMVQKVAAAGAPVIVAVSAPTALALRTADEAGITLIAVARSDGFEIFTHPHRVTGLATRPDDRKDTVEHAA